jgi:hypothetical protein
MALQNCINYSNQTTLETNTNPIHNSIDCGGISSRLAINQLEWGIDEEVSLWEFLSESKGNEGNS